MELLFAFQVTLRLLRDSLGLGTELIAFEAPINTPQYTQPDLEPVSWDHAIHKLAKSFGLADQDAEDFFFGTQEERACTYLFPDDRLDSATFVYYLVDGNPPQIFLIFSEARTFIFFMQKAK